MIGRPSIEIVGWRRRKRRTLNLLGDIGPTIDSAITEPRYSIAPVVVSIMHVVMRPHRRSARRTPSSRCLRLGRRL